MNQDRYQVKQLFSWSKKYNNGKWTNEEHAQFIDCLKKHGMDWMKLKEMIPTRTRVQIKSHSRRYFHQISKTFNTPTPLEYILTHNCANLRFDKKSKFSQNEKSSQNLKNFKEGNTLCSSSKNLYIFGHKENSEEIKENCVGKKLLLKKKKREIKLQEKIGDWEEERRGSKRFRYKKVFKIEKVEKGKKVMEIQRIDKKDEEKNTLLRNFASQSTLPSKSLSCENQDLLDNIPLVKNDTILMLNEGEIIIQGARIETSVPCDFSKTKDGAPIIIPKNNVKISLEPISKITLALKSSLPSPSTIQNPKTYQNCEYHKSSPSLQIPQFPPPPTYFPTEGDLILQLIKTLSDYYCYCF